MDTVTHTLFGLAIYGAVDKETMDKQMKRSLFVTSILGSQAPDFDVISRLWDTEGQYQMWHRGITHALIMAPVWALLLVGLSYLLFRVKSKKLFFIGLLAVLIHISSDLFNAWGTGYLEPFSKMRLSFGTIPIVDLAIWVLMAGGLLAIKIKKYASHQVYKVVWCIIVMHFFLQSAQGYILYRSAATKYDQVALSADFMPWHFQIIGKKGNHVEISEATVWSAPKPIYELTSAENVNLDQLFTENPKAKTLYEWSPFVVIVDNAKQIGIYDPRFYRNGQSFLFEFMTKNGSIQH